MENAVLQRSWANTDNVYHSEPRLRHPYANMFKTAVFQPARISAPVNVYIMKRRNFLQTAAALTVPAVMPFAAVTRQQVFPLHVLSSIRILTVFWLSFSLFGGNDGLNTVIPIDQFDGLEKPRPLTSANRSLPSKSRIRLVSTPALTGMKKIFSRKSGHPDTERRLPQAQPQPLPLDGYLDLGVQFRQLSYYRMDRSLPRHVYPGLPHRLPERQPAPPTGDLNRKRRPPDLRRNGHEL